MSALVLKLIAAAAMLIDHIAVVGYPFLFGGPGMQGAYVRDGSGAPLAGCIFREDAAAKRLSINELYFGSAADFRLLLGSVKRQYPEHSLTLGLPADTRVFDGMDNPRLLKRTVSAGPQFRVHSPEKALGFLKPRGSGCLSFVITDPLEPSPRRFSVRWDGPYPQVIPWNGVNEVATTIQRFSQIYCGCVRLTPENYGDFVSCDADAVPLLQALQPLNGPYRGPGEPG